MNQPPSVQSDQRASDWDAVRDRAGMLCLERGELLARRQRVDRWLIPVLVILWLVSVLSRALAWFDADARDQLEVTASGTALALLVVGILWLYISGRINLSAGTSPWLLLSKPDRRSIRRQIIGKAPVDLERADVVLELAYRQRLQTTGFLAFIVIELPNSLGTLLSRPDPIALTVGLAGLLFLLGLGIYGLITYRRITPIIHRLDR